MSFGNFVARSGGTVSISPFGARFRSGGVLLLFPSGTAAGFMITDSDPANVNRAFTVSLPADGAVTLSSGANSMTLKNFVSNPSGTGMLSAGGAQLTLGATLSVGSHQPPGNYTGTLHISLDYQ